MKGIVFNLLEEAVKRTHGEEAWDSMLASSGLEGAYTSLGTYPDEDLGRLVGAASALLGQPPDDVVRWFGRSALPFLAVKYPEFFTPHPGTRAFLLTLNDVIHSEVRKIYPGAYVPTLAFDTSDPRTLVMSYASKRRLCSFAEGLIEGAAAHFGEELTLEQPRCMKRGDDKCVFRISFSAEAARVQGP